MMRIEEILREIDRLPNREGKMLNFSQVEYLLARLSKDPSRLESLQKRSDQLGNRSFTIGEAVELVEKILWTRSKWWCGNADIEAYIYVDIILGLPSSFQSLGMYV